MTRVRDKGLFGFLKSRKIFTQGGHRTLREYLSSQELKEQNRLAERRNFKKAKYK